MIRVVDWVLGLLLRPRVRRVTRWSFVVTLPLAAVLISARGVDAMLVVFAAEFCAFMAVLALAARLGGERGQVILDMVMHPSVRRVLRSEAAIVTTLPAAVLRAVRGRPAGEWPYAKGDNELPFAIALTPAILAESAAVHLLLPDSLALLRLVLLVLSIYGLLWAIGWAAGLRVFPHRLSDGVLQVRLGQLYRADVPLELIASATVQRRRAGSRTALELGPDAASFAVGGRVDVHLELTAPVTIERPFGEPRRVTSLSLAADDPTALVRRLTAGIAPPPRPGEPSCAQPMTAST